MSLIRGQDRSHKVHVVGWLWAIGLMVWNAVMVFFRGRDCSHRVRVVGWLCATGLIGWGGR